MFEQAEHPKSKAGAKPKTPEEKELATLLKLGLTEEDAKSFMADQATKRAARQARSQEETAKN